MNPSVKLVYFPLRARVETIRLLLEVGGVKYEEEVVQFAEWPARKEKMPFLTLPVLYWDGEELGQSSAIARFVAKKVGLAGRTDEEVAKADAIFDHVSDIMTSYFEIRFNPDESQKKEKKESFRDKQFPQFLNTSERLLRASGGEFFTGNELTLADLAMFYALDFFCSRRMMSEGWSDVHEDLLRSMSGCNALTALHRRVKARPRIRAYLRRRPQYPF